MMSGTRKWRHVLLLPVQADVEYKPFPERLNAIPPRIASGYRNIMDINASFGGFIAALDSPKSWVMNVVSTLAGRVTQKIQILCLAYSYAEHQVTINIMLIWPFSSEFFYYHLSGYVIGAIPFYHGSVAPALNELCLGLKPKEVAPALSGVYAKDVHVRMACFLLYRPVLFLRR
ncbi:probable methyltransferase PMT2 [Tanacetum coccineum]